MLKIKNEQVKVYWIMYDKKDKHEEELNYVERTMAYGLSTKPAKDDGHHIVTLVALKKRPLEVWCDDDGTLHAVGEMNGKRAEFLHVDITSESGWTGPKVVQIIIIGKNKDGGECKEIIKP